MNKYRIVAPIEPEGMPGAAYTGTMDLSKGLIRNVSPREIELGASPFMENVRFERTGIRKDFGDRDLGTPAPSKVLCIIEHKFIDASNNKFSRLIRLMRHTDGRARTEIYNSETEEWEEDALTVTQTIQDGFVRGVSVRGVLLFACFGSPILQRTEVPAYSLAYHDFDAGNSLDAKDEYISEIVVPQYQVRDNEYTVWYDVDLTLTTGIDLVVEVALYVDGEFYSSELYTQAIVGSSSYDNESQTFVKDVEGYVEVMLKVENVYIGGTTEQSTTLAYYGGTPEYYGTKASSAEAHNDTYSISFDVEMEEDGGGATVSLYYDIGSGWVLYGTEGIDEGFVGSKVFDIVIDGAGANSKFGFSIEGTGQETGWGEVTGLNWIKWYTQGTASYSFAVHGHNLPTDGDAHHGIEFYEQDSKAVTLAPISGAPEATWIESFGDRIVALRDDGDTQQFSASADGTHDNWTTLDSVETILVDTRNDPIDDLQCAGPLAANVLAVIRSRSIMKAFETGNYDLAVGVTHWLEGVGTESPHSIAITPAGLMFLGHDYMVYLLSESGILPLGDPIVQELIENLTDNLDKVDGIYDPVYQEYWLGIPEGGEEHMTATYIFDVGKLISSQGQIRRWRKRVQNVQRYAIVSSAV